MSMMETIEAPTETAAMHKPAIGLIVAAIAIIAAFQLHLALTRTINWDEFYFFGQIVDFNSGTDLRPLQTLHVQLFAWLPGAARTGVDAIVLGRVVMWAFSLATAACVMAIAQAFARREIALVAALVWLTAGFTMQHGWSFRTDPIAAFLITAALAVLARARLSIGSILIAGAFVGLAGMITLKSILLAPAFAGLAWLRWSQSGFAKATAFRIAAVPIAAMVIFVATYFAHSASLGHTDSAGGGEYVGSVGGAMLFAGWPIYLNLAVKGAVLSVVAAAAIVVSLFCIANRSRDHIIAVAGLMLPLAAILIYRNMLPYFYPMVLAPVIAGSAIGIVAIADRYGTRLLIAAALISGTGVWAIDGPTHQSKQRDLQLAADAIFDQPVGYFDFSDMLPQHRKANGFLTRWGIESIYSGGPGYFRTRLEAQSVPLLLTAEPAANPTLLAVMNDLPQAARFHQAERDVLRATYRPFWGPFWLAGAEMLARSEMQYEVLVPGPYTITGGDLEINGVLHSAGSIVLLDRGSILLANDGNDDAGIIWGEQLKVPGTAPPDRPFWRGF